MNSKGQQIGDLPPGDEIDWDEIDWEALDRANDRVGREQATKHRVFVYGSLLQGLHNHSLLERDSARLVGSDRTAEHAFLMINMGAYPGVIVSAGPARAQVVGEVYEVDGPTLANLDRLEGHPNFYHREQVRLTDGTWAWMYILQRHGQAVRASLVPGNDWRTYLDSRAAV